MVFLVGIAAIPLPTSTAALLAALQRTSHPLVQNLIQTLPVATDKCLCRNLKETCGWRCIEMIAFALNVSCVRASVQDSSD
jgi:hypothetical protein